MTLSKEKRPRLFDLDPLVLSIHEDSVGQHVLRVDWPDNRVHLKLDSIDLTGFRNALTDLENGYHKARFSIRSGANSITLTISSSGGLVLMGRVTISLWFMPSFTFIYTGTMAALYSLLSELQKF